MISEYVVFAFKVGDEWRVAVGSRTGPHEVCLDKEDAIAKGEFLVRQNGRGTVKVFDNERPIGSVGFSS